MSQHSRPNILYIITDQQRYDTIAALGNERIYTPNMDRLVRRGVAFSNAYSTCPVCVAARYTVRTGCEPPRTRVFTNGVMPPAPGQGETMAARCGPYLAETMREHGYRTFGIGKFHTSPWDEELGYECHLYSEEMYHAPEKRRGDHYAAWIAEQHPQFDFIEMLMGERTEMYYMPQMSPLPAEIGVEAWASDRAVEQILAEDDRPYFGFLSFIGPHPPLAPPLPFNRMYNPDSMPTPIKGDLSTDHMDEQIPWMNYAVYAENITDEHTRILYSRYYGEISYIDQCLGKVLDAVEQTGQAENTLICFVSDHGDHMGDHHAWQKESFFESSCRIPFLLSWPRQIEAGMVRDDLVCLTDLFAIATSAAGHCDVRDGIDVLGMLNAKSPAREQLIGCHGEPGTNEFKAMLRFENWKYIYMCNGGLEQLFDLKNDPHELINLAATEPEIASQLKDRLTKALMGFGAIEAVSNRSLKCLPYRKRPLQRILQFDGSRGVTGFPAKPSDVIVKG